MVTLQALSPPVKPRSPGERRPEELLMHVVSLIDMDE
jgi:hypothetical protein